MEFSKSEIEVKILEYQDKIKKYNYLLRKGHSNPSELRNAVIDYRVEIQKLEKLMEVC
jgi:hypothetical protein